MPVQYIPYYAFSAVSSMNTKMPLKIARCLENLRANVAAERPVPSVDTKMNLETIAAAEAV